MSRPTEDDILTDIVEQTAQFRYCVRWESGRRLLESRGVNPMMCWSLSCSPGADVHLTFLLPDGQFVAVELAEDPATRQFVAINVWEPYTPSDLEAAIALGGLSGCSLDLTHQGIWHYYQTHLQAEDGPLPS